MVVDGVWSLIGSANWDPRSLRLNFEFNVECYDGGAIGSGAAWLPRLRTIRSQCGRTGADDYRACAAIPLGGGVGLGLGLATKSVVTAMKTALAGIAAGAVAGAIYPIAVSLLFPEASTDALLPAEASTRLLWVGIVSGAIGVIIPLAGRE